jgi:hypothetical protein
MADKYLAQFLWSGPLHLVTMPKRPSAFQHKAAPDEAGKIQWPEMSLMHSLQN